MNKEETYNTRVYVENRQESLPVSMYTDEYSEVCSIRFGNSFTLNVVTPQDLLMLAQDIEAFVKRAQEFHYAIEKDLEESDAFYSALIDQNMAAASKTPTPDPQCKVERLMQGTVSAPLPDPMNDPVNW